jgi:hypothetical protein
MITQVVCKGYYYACANLSFQLLPATAVVDGCFNLRMYFLASQHLAKAHTCFKKLMCAFIQLAKCCADGFSTIDAARVCYEAALALSLASQLLEYSPRSTCLQ